MKGLTHFALMRESERRIEAAACADDPQQQLVASGVLGDTGKKRAWELEHSRYMRLVARWSGAEQQLTALRTVTFGLIHRKALFEYLRVTAVRGDERRRVLALFHGSRACSDVIVAEHGLYLRSAASHLCTAHIGGNVVGDPAFDEPFGAYQRYYFDYFGLFCQTRVRRAGSAELAESVLLPYLKLKVAEQRAAILALHGARPARSRPSTITRLQPPVAA